MAVISLPHVRYMFLQLFDGNNVLEHLNWDCFDKILDQHRACQPHILRGRRDLYAISQVTVTWDHSDQSARYKPKQIHTDSQSVQLFVSMNYVGIKRG